MSPEIKRPVGNGKEFGYTVPKVLVFLKNWLPKGYSPVWRPLPRTFWRVRIEDVWLGDSVITTLLNQGFMWFRSDYGLVDINAKSQIRWADQEKAFEKIEASAQNDIRGEFIRLYTKNRRLEFYLDERIGRGHWQIHGSESLGEMTLEERIHRGREL